MKTKFNRFALLPFHCTDCHRMIWLEPYRKAEVFNAISPHVPSYTTRKICNECLRDYNVKEITNDR